MTRNTKTVTVFSRRDKSYELTFLVHPSASPEEIALAVGNRTDNSLKRVYELYFWEIEK